MTTLILAGLWLATGIVALYFAHENGILQAEADYWRRQWKLEHERRCGVPWAAEDE